MLSRSMALMGACLLVNGCGETDRELYEQLPALSLASLPEGFGLPDCGDMIPRQGDIVLRLVTANGSDRVVVLRDDVPLCTDELSDWLGEDDPAGAGDQGPEATVQPLVEPEPEPDPASDVDPADHRTAGRKLQQRRIRGPHPIPWVYDDDE